MAKSDIATFHHVVSFIKNCEIYLPEREHKKLAKVAIKRINRISNSEKDQSSVSNNKYSSSPFLDLLKMLDSFEYIRGIEGEQLKTLCDQIQKIIELKVS